MYILNIDTKKLCTNDKYKKSLKKSKYRIYENQKNIKYERVYAKVHEWILPRK